MSNVQEQTVQISEARKAKYPVILDTLQRLRTNKAITDQDLHPILNKSWEEAKYYGEEAIIMFKRVLLHIGDVSRHHNILKQAGINSNKGGAGERANFRSVMRWWEQYQKTDFYTKLGVFTDFTVLDNLLYDQVRTDRMKGKLKSQERMGFDVKIIASFFADRIRNSKNPLIARHLPKYASGKYRYTNGKKREKQSFTLAKEKRTREFINTLIEILGWDLKEYREYRKKQSTPEQLFSSKEILNLSEDLLMKMFDRMTSSQRFRVAHMLAEKDKFGHLTAKEKWGELGNLYIKWENNQSKVATLIREETDEVKREKISKDFKVKATGMQTIDILAKMLQGRESDDQINNTYQALLEKMDLVGNVFPIIDGSASMRRSVTNIGWGGYGEEYAVIDNKFAGISLFDIAASMAIAFATRNPNEDYRNTFGWFSKNFVIVGQSKYVNTAPNPYVAGQKFIRADDGLPAISEKYPFTKNLIRIRQSNPGIIGSTNVGAAIEYFVRLHTKVGMDTESLPGALLSITDNEGNIGMPPNEFMAHAASIGWHPLVIFWGIKYNKMSQYENIPNCLFIGGFSESVLGQILRGIKNGSIMPETELWSINDDKRYSVMS